MFKYLLLKIIYELSDVDVVERSLYGMSFKYFLNMTLEDTDLIDPARELVLERAKSLRKVIYRVDETLKEKLPQNEKPE